MELKYLFLYRNTHIFYFIMIISLILIGVISGLFSMLLKSDQDIKKNIYVVALTSLIFSILSIFIGPPGFILGISGGHLAWREINKNQEIKGAGIALAALIIGYFSVFLFVIVYLQYYAFAYAVGRRW